MYTIQAALRVCAREIEKRTTNDRVFLEMYYQCERKMERLNPPDEISWRNDELVSDGQIMTVLAQVQNPFVYHPEYNQGIRWLINK